VAHLRLVGTYWDNLVLARVSFQHTIARELIGSFQP
jgi:hypothetical protein